jgi:hypothetical protein
VPVVHQNARTVRVVEPARRERLQHPAAIVLAVSQSHRRRRASLSSMVLTAPSGRVVHAHEHRSARAVLAEGVDDADRVVRRVKRSG